MKNALLLDTHVLLWSAFEPARIPPKTLTLLSKPTTSLWISIASAWELSIKASLGRLTLPGTVSEFIERAEDEIGIQVLPLELRHINLITTLPFHHRDPFDRLLLAQAQAEKLTLVSADTAFDRYRVERVW